MLPFSGALFNVVKAIKQTAFKTDGKVVAKRCSPQAIDLGVASATPLPCKASQLKF